MSKIRFAGLPGVASYTATFYSALNTSAPGVSIQLTEVDPGNYEGDVPGTLGAGNHLVIFENAGREVARIYYDSTTGMLPGALDVYTVLLLLGYHNPDVDLTNARINQPDVAIAKTAKNDIMRVTLPSVYGLRAIDIAAALKKLDAAIAESFEESMIMQTCKTTMNWGGHLKMLRSQAHHHLIELAQIYGIRVARSKYTITQKPYTIHYQ